MGAADGLDPRAIRVEGAGGVGINVWDYGGAGPALVLAHCTGTHARVWDPLVSELLADFHVYAPDTRGHGDSDKPEDPEAYHWRFFGDDLVAVIEALDLGHGIFGAGHSAGAAQIGYAQWRRPGTFAYAVMIDPIIGPEETAPKPNPLAEKARRRKSLFESREAAKERFASKPPINRWDTAVLDAYLQYGFADSENGGVEIKCPGPIEAAVYDRGGSSDLFEQLGLLDLPCTLVTGSESDVRGLAELQRERLRPSDYIVLEGVSHFIPQERPDVIAALIREKCV